MPEARPAAGPAPWRRFLRNGRAAAGLTLLIAFYLLAALAPWASPYGPDQQRLEDRLRPPGAQHWMGTDQFGRDVLSRAVFGARVSQAVGLVAMAISLVVGVTVGAVGGFYGLWLDQTLSRLTEAVLTFPSYFIMIAVVALFGTGFTTLVLVIGLTAWPVTARVVRAEVLSLRVRPFVEAAVAVGGSNLRVLVRHVLPNVVPVVVVAATLRVAYVILAEAGLSYLGFGIQPPTPSWGTMVAEGRSVLRSAWWITLFPGAFIFLSVMAYNLVGDGLRDALDPRMSRRSPLNP